MTLTENEKALAEFEHNVRVEGALVTICEALGNLSVAQQLEVLARVPRAMQMENSR